MKALMSVFSGVCALAILGACGDASTRTGSEGSRVSIHTAPLNLAGVVGVEYALAVFNDHPGSFTDIFDIWGAVQAHKLDKLVWQQPSITSNQYGNGPGGDISYPGPCDASVGRLNYVAIAIKQIAVAGGEGSYDGNGPFAGTDNVLDDQNSAYVNAPGSNDFDPDFVNPAPYNDASVLAFWCTENADTAAVFNLTVLRDADQGFFDIVVKFDDIFCSMKIDSCYTDGERIRLLFDDNDPDDNGSRVDTTVLAAACSAGKDSGGTVMWMAPVALACDGGVSFTLDPTGGATPGVFGVPGHHCASVVLSEQTEAAYATGGLYFPQVGDGDEVFSMSGWTLYAGTRCQAPDASGARDFFGNLYELTSDFTVPDPATPNVAAPAVAVVVGPGSNLPNPGRHGWWVCSGTFSVNGSVQFSGAYDFNGSTGIFDGGQSEGGTSQTTDVCYALYWGEEDLLCDGAPCNKEYWSVAINTDHLADANLTNCAITTAVTASDAGNPPFIDGRLPGPGQTYPYVLFDANLTAADGNTTCFQGPLGSNHARTLFGSSSDQVNGTPFPQLCYYLTQGDTSPLPLDLPVCP